MTLTLKTLILYGLTSFFVSFPSATEFNLILSMMESLSGNQIFTADQVRAIIKNYDSDDENEAVEYN